MAVALALMTNVKASVIEVMVAPAGMPVPVMAMPGTSPTVLPTVTFGEPVVRAPPVSVADKPSVPPVTVAAPVELSKSTPPDLTVRVPPSVSVWAPASFKELIDSAPVTLRSAVDR